MPSCQRPWTDRWAVLAWVVFAVVFTPWLATAQLAPVVGTHYAARASDTGFQGMVNAQGGYGASVPLDLPAARGGLPVPVQVVYGGKRVGAAGVGWDVPLSFIFRSTTIAHRRPAVQPSFSVEQPLPIQAPEQLSLTLGGERLDLVRNATDTAWVARRNGPQIEVRAPAHDVLVLDDGEGRTYTFTSEGAPAGSRLIGGNLYLLRNISGADGNVVHLSYRFNTPALPGDGTGLAINLDRVLYNTSPTTANCYKHGVYLNYDAPTPSPLAITILGGTPLVRVQKLVNIFVYSSANCTTPGVRLRTYSLDYLPDTDTQQPRLHSVTMYGQEGTPEENVRLPVATYAYGSIVDPATHAITYQLTQTGGPRMIIGAPHYAYGISFTDGGPSSEPHAPHDVLRDYGTGQAFIDLNGDGRPDFMGQGGSYRNMPGPNGTMIFSSERLGTPGLIEMGEKIHSATIGKNPDGSYIRLGEVVVNDTLKQLIDINGDGRLDIIETVLPDAGCGTIPRRNGRKLTFKPRVPKALRSTPTTMPLTGGRQLWSGS